MSKEPDFLAKPHDPTNPQRPVSGPQHALAGQGEEGLADGLRCASRQYLLPFLRPLARSSSDLGGEDVSAAGRIQSCCIAFGLGLKRLYSPGQLADPAPPSGRAGGVHRLGADHDHAAATAGNR